MSHVFTDGVTWVVAASSKDAHKVYCAHYGIPIANINTSGWRQEPDDKVLTGCLDSDAIEMRKCGDWAKLKGYGVLGRVNAE